MTDQTLIKELEISHQFLLELVLGTTPETLLFIHSDDQHDQLNCAFCRALKVQKEIDLM